MMTFYGLLLQCSNGTTPCRSHLVKMFGDELVDDAIEQGYIREIRKNSSGEPVYQITLLGKDARDR